MSEENDQPETQQPATESPAPNAAAIAALDTAAQRRAAAAAPRRPPRAAPAAALPAAVAPPAGPPRERPNKRKKKSGRHLTRAELAAKVKAYERGEIQPRATAAELTPASGAAPSGPAIIGNDERKAQFARGTARLLRAVGRFVARRRGAHWQLDEQDAGDIGEAAADCLEATEEMIPAATPYIAKAMQLAPFGMLAGGLYEIVDSRLEIEQQIKAGEVERIMPGTSKPAVQLHKAGA